VTPAGAALACRCPRCGRGKLYAGLLSIAPVCPACGLDLKALDTGDGPTGLVVLLLGAIAVGLAILVEILFSPPFWVHVLLWVPAVIGGAILLLRPLKSWMIALQYRHAAK
jgi:uncharacterized protein (DUF983 family)